MAATPSFFSFNRFHLRFIACAFLFLSISALTPLNAVIRHHTVEASQYQKLAEPFYSAVKVIGQSEFGLKSVEGSGIIIKSPHGTQTALLTAAHVLENADKFHYYALIKNQKIALKLPQTFLSYLNNTHQEKAAVAIDLRLKRSYFGTRLPIKDLKISENLKNLGIDLAIAFFEHPVPVHLASPIAAPLSYPSAGLKSVAVGFGQTGTGGSLFSLSKSLSRISEKRAFEIRVKPAFILKLMDFKTGYEIKIPTLVSIFEENKGDLSFPGHISSGDSGGPVFIYNKKTQGYEAIAMIIANLPYVETEVFKSSKENHYFLNAVKGVFERGSPLSSFFFQEANIYGSEGYYIDMTNIACKAWLSDAFQKEFGQAPKENSTIDKKL